MRVALLVVCVVALAVAGSRATRAADDDFTDIPDFGDPTPSAPPAKPSAPPSGPPPGPGPAAGASRDLVSRYEEGRLAAFADRVLSLTVCGRNLRDGDSRRAHAYVADGDAWLARGDEAWERALRTGDRTGLDRALRNLKAAHQAYLAARNPPPLSYTGRDSPKPRPFPSARPSEEHPGPGMGEVVEPEPEQWRRHDTLPIEEPSRFESDPHY